MMLIQIINVFFLLLLPPPLVVVLFLVPFCNKTDEVVLPDSANLLGGLKIVFLKVSVGLIVLQGLIEEFLFTFEIIKPEPTNQFNPAARAQRVYCKRLLCLSFLDVLFCSVLFRFVSIVSAMNSNN